MKIITTPNLLLLPLLATAFLVVCSVVQAQEVEELDCYADDVMVTNKTTCDIWCGGLGAYEGKYVVDSKTTPTSQFTGPSCDCTKDIANATFANKTCTGNYDTPDCYTEGVTDKPTCDTWCGGTGAYTGSFSGDKMIGLTCECTDKNAANPEPVTQWCISSGVSTTFFGAMTASVMLALAASM